MHNQYKCQSQEKGISCLSIIIRVLIFQTACKGLHVLQGSVEPSLRTIDGDWSCRLSSEDPLPPSLSVITLRVHFLVVGEGCVLDPMSSFCCLFAGIITKQRKFTCFKCLHSIFTHDGLANIEL